MTSAPSVESIRVVCGPTTLPRPTRLRPRSVVPGSITASASISTSASIQVASRVGDRDPGEHVALEDAPARLALATASSARVLTPKLTLTSSTLWASTRPPCSRSAGSTSPR